MSARGPPGHEDQAARQQVAVCWSRVEVIVAVRAVKVSTVGLYSSAVLRLVSGVVKSACQEDRAVGEQGRRMARARVVIVAVTAVKVSVVGSYSSAVPRAVTELLDPPVMRTSPFRAGWLCGRRERVSSYW